MSKRRGNARKLLYRVSQLLILQDIERLHFLGWNVMQIQYLNCGSRETTLGIIRSAFHEKNDGGFGNGSLNLRPYFLG